MKKIFSIICLALISLGLVACGVSGDERVIDLETVIEANEYNEVLKEHNNVLANKVTFADVEKNNIKNRSEGFLVSSENDGLMADITYFDHEGNITLSESVRDGLVYQVCGNDFGMKYVGENKNDQYITENHFSFIPNNAEYSDVVVEPLYAYFEVKYTRNAFIEVPVDNNEDTTETKVIKQTVDVVSTYFIDLETLLYTNVEHVYKVGQEVVEINQIKFYYNVSKYELEINAYEKHQNSENLIELTIVVNHETSNEKSYKYNVAGSSVVTYYYDDYRLYKNPSYTKDVINLDYIIDYATVYYYRTQPEISWSYTLVPEDLTEFISIRDELQSAIIENEERSIVEALMEKFNDKFEYVEAHYIIGQVNFYKNTTNNDNYQAFLDAVDMYYEMFEEYKSFCVAIWESESIYKEEFFEGWTEEDIQTLYVDPQASELRQQMTEIEEKVNKLNYQSNSWNKLVCNLYNQYIDISKQYAEYYGYDNYYEYATEKVYSRDYTKDDLALFHQYVKEYIVPLTKKTMAEAEDAMSDLESNEQYILKNLLNKNFNGLGSLNYVNSYIDTFDGQLQQNFKNLFEKNAYILQNTKNAYEGAFVNYISYYEEPFAYFGPGYQTTYTVIHEMGHYAAAYNYNFGGLNYDLAETHSQANEWLFTYYLKQLLSANSQAVLVKQNLAEALQMVVIATAIDEFEQTIYYGNYLPTEYESVMAEIHASYDMDDIYSLTDMQWYWKMVAVSSAVYYISYATSQIASINLYVVAEQYGYEYAQEVYRKLQEEGSSEQGFVEVILNSGLPNPFLEQTYIDMVEVFSNLE